MSKGNFDWVRIPEGLPKQFLIEIVAKTLQTTDHRGDKTLPPQERKRRIYLPEELHEAARSLAFRPINGSHKKAIPDAYVIDAQYNKEQDQVETLCFIPSLEYIGKLKSGKINGFSVEEFVREEIDTPEGVLLKGITFTGLALVEEPYKPGDKGTSFELLKESGLFFRVESVLSLEPSVLEESKKIGGKEMKKKKLGEPFADYADWEACIADCRANHPEVKDCEAWCGAIKAKVEEAKKEQVPEEPVEPEVPIEEEEKVKQAIIEKAPEIAAQIVAAVEEPEEPIEEQEPEEVPKTQEACEAKGWFWYDDACHKEPKPEEKPLEEAKKLQSMIDTSAKNMKAMKEAFRKKIAEDVANAKKEAIKKYSDKLKKEVEFVEGLHLRWREVSARRFKEAVHKILVEMTEE